MYNRNKDKSAYFTEKYVRYRREEKSVAEQWLIRIHRLVPAEQIMGDQPLEIKINLNVELWFGETNDDQEMDFNNCHEYSKWPLLIRFGPFGHYKNPTQNWFHHERLILS